MVSFGLYLLGLRKKAGLTGQELADKSGVSKTYIWQLENEHRNAPKPDKLALLAPALGVSYNEMMRAAGYTDAPDELKAAGVNYLLLDEYVKGGLTEAEIKQTLDFLVYHKSKENVE